MAVILGIAGVLCLVYYGVIALYSGVETSFSGIWIVLAVCLLLMSLVVYLFPRFKERIPMRLEVAAITVVATLFAVFIIVEAAMFLNFFSLKKQSADYVIVLGAQVRGNAMSHSLKYRLERAAEYAAVHPNTVFILSGGKGPGENISDAAMMHKYLRDCGVPEYQLIMEEASRSTYENLVYSKILINAREAMRRETIRDIMAANGYLVPPDDETPIRVGIVTSNFHVLRAKGIAKKIGLPNVSGIAAKSDPVLFVHFCVRECFAILKDKFVGNM